MKFKFFFIAVMFLTFLTGCRRLDENVKEFSKEGRWEILNFEGRALLLDCDSSKVIIRGKKGAKDATIRYVKKIFWEVESKKTSNTSFSESEVGKIFDEMAVKLENTLDRVYIKAKAYSGEAILANTVSNPKREFEFEVFLPEKSKILVQNGDGNVSISGIQGGSIYIVNGKGNVTVTDVKASIDIKNGEGNVKLDYIDGDFSINNGNGDINLKVDRTSTFKVVGTKGNINAKIEKVDGFGLSSFVSLGEGNIAFFVGKNVKAQIKLNTKGRVQSNFDMVKMGKHYYIDLDSGKNKIEIINLNGTVRIEKNY